MEARAPLNGALTPTLDKHCNREWLDGADEGVILVSFGSVSNYETDSCPKEKSAISGDHSERHSGGQVEGVPGRVLGPEGADPDEVGGRGHEGETGQPHAQEVASSAGACNLRSCFF